MEEENESKYVLSGISFSSPHVTHTYIMHIVKKLNVRLNYKGDIWELKTSLWKWQALIIHT